MTATHHRGLRYLRETGRDTIEPLPSAEDDWVDHHNEVIQVHRHRGCGRRTVVTR